MAVLRALLALRFRGRSRLGLAALLAVSTLATVGVVAGLEVRAGAGGRLDGLFAETGEPDLVVIGGPNGVPRALAAAQAAGLVDAATLFDASFASFERPDGTAVGMGLVAVNEIGSAEVGRPILRSGRWPRTADEFVLDAGAATAHDHQVGSVVAVERNGLPHQLTVVGTAVDLSDCFYPTCLPLRGYLSPEGLAAISPEGQFARAHVRLNDGFDEAAAAEWFRDSGFVDTVDTWSANRSDLLLPGRVFSAFLAGFGLFVLIATLLVVASTAVGSVVARRRELGLLKALGATPTELLAVTVLEQLLVGLGGVMLGWVLGSLLAPWLQLGLVGVLGREAPQFDIGTLAVVIAAMALVLTVATIAPARQAGSLPARAALADAPPVKTGGFRSTLRRLPLSPPSLLGVQLAVARPVRAVLASTAVAVAVAAGLAGWRVSSAVDVMLADPGRAGDPYDVLVGAPPGVSRSALGSTLAEVDGVRDWYTESGERGRLDGHDIGVRAIGERIDDAALVVVEGRMPDTPSEALAGWGLVGDGTVAIGDTVDVLLPDGTLSVTVVGRHGDLDNSGEVLVVSMPAYEAVVGSARQHWRVSGDGTVDRRELARRIESAFDGGALVQPASDAAGQLRPFRTVLAVLVALVASVAAANLGATLVAGTRERRRELGVVRALGFSKGDLRRQASSSGVVLGLVGVGLGIPAGLVASNQVLGAAVEEIGLGPGLLDPPRIGPALAALVLGVGLAAVVAVIATHRIHSVPTAELVREA